MTSNLFIISLHFLALLSSRHSLDPNEYCTTALMLFLKTNGIQIGQEKRYDHSLFLSLCTSSTRGGFMLEKVFIMVDSTGPISKVS